MAFRDNAKEYFEQTDYYKELTDSEKTEFLDIVTSNRREFLNFLDNEPNFQELNLDERKEFLSIIDPENYAIEPEPTPAPEQPMVWERAQDRENEWDKPMANVAKRTIGTLTDFAAGALQLGSDFTVRAVSDSALDVMRVPPEKREEVRKNLAQENAVSVHAITQNMDSTIAYLRGATKKLFQETEEYKQGLDTKGKFAYDTTVNIVDALPTIAAMVYTGGAAAFATAVAKAMGSEYGRAREARYEPAESLAIASVPGATAGVSAALNAKVALDISKPLMRRIFTNLAIDAGTDFSAPMIKFFADYATDNWYKTNQGDLLAENDTVDKAFYRSLWNVATGVGNSVLFSTAPDIARAGKMWAEGLKATKTKDGQIIIHPVEMTDAVDTMVRDNDFSGVDAQQAYNQSEGSLIASARTAKRLDDIQELQASRPLDELDLDPQAGPSKKMGRLKVDMEVDVSPKYFTEMDNKPRNMGKPAKVVKNTYPVEQTVQTIPPGGVAPITQTKRNLFVDVEFPDEPGVIYTIPRKYIVEKTRTPNSVPHEAARLVRFMSDLFFPQNIPVSEWSADNARMALGGFLSVNESLGRKALGQVKGTTGGMVWDAMRNNPEDAARILSHEPGHIFAEADAEVLKSMNIPEFDGFKQWVKQATESADADVLNRYEQAKKQTPELALEDFVLTEKYGDELTKLWNDWSLFKSKIPNAKELAANALSVYMNDVMGGEAVPGFRSMKIRADLSDWVNSQPNLKLAFEGLRAYDFAEPGSLNAALNGMFTKASQALAVAAETGQGVKKTLLQQTADNFQNKMYSFLDRMRHDPAMVERYEGSLMTPGRAAHYVERSFGETYKTLVKNGISPEDFRNYTFWKRLTGDRIKTVERLSKDSSYDTMEDYQRAYNEESQRIRSDIRGNNPNFTDKEVQQAVQAHMKMFAESSVVGEEVQMHNPGGFTKADAAAALSELATKYGPEKYAVMEARHKAEHDAFVTWGIPVLRESKLFSEAILNHMENNQDYATFVVVHHAFNSKKNNGKNKGSLNFIHEQMGTLGFIDDPHAQTNLLRARMIMAADQAGMQRDLVEGSAAFEAQHFPDAPRTRLLAPGEEPRNGYDVFTSQKYNNATGKVEEVRYEFKKGFLDGFDKVVHDNYILSGLNFIHGAMKGWMTVFNPRFWIRNFCLDMARSVINAPGLKSYEIIPDSLSALKQDLGYRWRGEENPEYQEMMLARQIAGDARAQHTIDNNLSPHDRIMMMADLNPKFFNKTWKEIDGVFNKLHYLYDLSTGWWKKGSTFIGSSTEFASKAGMKRYLKRRFPKMDEADVNWYIRNAAGTPLQNRVGNWNPYLSNAVLFYNPNMQGMVSDIQAIKRDPYNNIIKRIAAVAGHMALRTLALEGLIGEDLRKWAEAIPKYLRSRGFNIPLMFSADGDAGTLTIPTDATTRVMLAAADQTVNKLRNGTFSATDIGGSILGEAAEGAPSLAPIWQGFKSGAEYLWGEKGKGGNPEDFMGVPAMSPELYASSDTWAKRAAMITHFMQQGWGGPLNAMGFTPLLRAQFSTKVDRPGVDNPTNVERMNSTLKDFLKIPVIGYTLGGLIKFSSGGLKELAEDRAAPSIEQHADERRVVRQTVDTLANGGQATPEELALLRDKRHEKYAAKRAQMILDLRDAAKLNRSDLTPLINLIKQNPREELENEYYLMLLERMNKK